MNHQQNRPSHGSFIGETSARTVSDKTIRVLHVDDDPDFLEVTTMFLEQEHDAITVVTETHVSDALDRLATEQFDCIVSDYDMPSTDGLEFLRHVRKDNPDLPFILYTGRGSEEIASEAISAGVTGYLQKETGSDQYTVLANRIENSVSKYHAERVVEETRERFQKLIEHSTDVISIVDANGRWQYLTPSTKRVLGYEPEELIGEVGFDYVHPEDRPNAMEKFAHAIKNPDQIPTNEFRFDHPDGWIWLENRARNMVEDPIINGFVIHSRDVSDRARREQELTRQNQRLEEVINVMSHDLRDPLNVAYGSLELGQQNGDSDHFETAKKALDRVDSIIDDLVTLAQEGKRVDELSPVTLGTVVADAWEVVETHDARLIYDEEEKILADRSGLQRVLENLFQNAVRHGETDVSVSVGTTDEGLYVADDGPGIEADIVDRVFESGYSTNETGTGFGLSIVKEIVAAHDWEIYLIDSNAGGARFEITGVTFV